LFQSLLVLASACSDDPPTGPGSSDVVGATTFVTEVRPFAKGEGAVDETGSPWIPTSVDREANHIDGDRLVRLDSRRGLQVHDLAQPTRPRLLGSLPVSGVPVDMYVSGATVHALMSDVVYVSQQPAGPLLSRHRVSQLVVIDISDPQRPRRLRSLDMDGKLVPGAIVKTGGVIHVVALGREGDPEPQAWLYRFDVSSAAEPVEKDRRAIFRGGEGSVPMNGAVVQRSFRGMTARAAGTTLVVSEHWWTTPDLGMQCFESGPAYADQQAVVTVFQLGDGDGALTESAHFTTSAGWLDDTSRVLLLGAPGTSSTTLVGAFKRRGSNGCGGVRLGIEVWDLTAANAVRAGGVELLDLDLEQVALDGQRRLAHVLARPGTLRTVSFAEPRSPSVGAPLEGMPFNARLLRQVGEGRFVLAVGTVLREACPETPPQLGSLVAAVSLADVTDAGRPRLVQRKCLPQPVGPILGSDFGPYVEAIEDVLSSNGLTPAEVQDLRRPLPVVSLEPPWRSASVHRFGDYLVEQQESPQGRLDRANPGLSRFQVRRAGGPPGAPVASFEIDYVNWLFKHRELLVVIHDVDLDYTGVAGTPEVVIMDLRDPTRPQERARVRMLGLPGHASATGIAGRGAVFGGGALFAQSDQGVAFYFPPAAPLPWTELHFLDLRNPAVPTVRKRALPGDIDQDDVRLVPDLVNPTRFYLSYRRPADPSVPENAQLIQYRHQVQRWSLSVDGTLEPEREISLPGHLLQTWADPGGGRLLLAQDSQYRQLVNGDWVANMRLSLLREVRDAGGPLAQLVAQQAVPGPYPSSLLRDGGRLVISAADRLAVYDLDRNPLRLLHAVATGLDGLIILAGEDGRLFADTLPHRRRFVPDFAEITPGDGIVVLDLSQPTSARATHFLPTGGQARGLETWGDDSYVAAGALGLIHVDVASPSNIAGP
jgi:hypothetical protein